MGVDVMRWLYCAHKPENNLPFGYQRADEVRRQFLIPLWNMYSFFVTYANLDGWEPTTARGSSRGVPRARRHPATTPLDTWICGASEPGHGTLHRPVWRTRTRTPPPLAIAAFLDDLSNW